MSTYDDDDIEFDFFDEPETVEGTRGRRGSKGGDGGRPPRSPLRAPTGLVPLARLVGLIALAIAIVIGLVFWISSCQGKSKHDRYASYASDVDVIAKAENKRGAEFANEFVTSGLKQSELVTKLQGLAQQEQQAYTQAQEIRPPGPLRAVHQNMVNAIQLRYEGLTGLADVLAGANLKDAKTQSQTVSKLTSQGALLTASDVVWAQLYQQPATQVLKDRGVTGVVIPSSVFITNPEIVSARSFGILVQRLGGASTGGTPSGKHGNGLISVRVTPQGTDLSTTTATTVKVSADLAFVATVENSGDFQEVDVTVKLTIDVGGSKPIQKTQKIPVIQPAEQQTVKFTGFDIPPAAFGNRATVKVQVLAVPGEVNLSNNSASYAVFFTLS